MKCDVFVYLQKNDQKTQLRFKFRNLLVSENPKRSD